MEEEMTEVLAQESPIFDFTQRPQPSDGDAFRIYSMLNRNAILKKNKKLLPEGKTYTHSQLVEILGEDYARAAGIVGNCCG